MGLGHDGFDEKTKAVKMQKAQEVPQPVPEPPPSDNWKRSVRKRRIVYKTMDDVKHQQSTSTKPTPLIDMTGGYIPEPRHNIQVIVDAVSRDLVTLAREIDSNTHEKQQFEFTFRKSSEEIAGLSAQHERVVEIISAIHELNEIMESTPPPTTNQELKTLFELIKPVSDTLESLDALDVLVSGISSHLSQFLSRYSHHSHGTILLEYRHLLVQDTETEFMSGWEVLLHSTLLPILRTLDSTSLALFIKTYHPVHTPPRVRWNDGCLIPYWMFWQICTHITTIASANELGELIDLLPTFHVTQLCDSATRRMVVEIQKVRLEKLELRDRIAAFVKIVDTAHSRSVLSALKGRIEYLMNRGLVIDPRNQSLELLDLYCKWVDILDEASRTHIAAVVQDKLKKVLKEWMSAGGHVTADIEEWKQEWIGYLSSKGIDGDFAGGVFGTTVASTQSATTIKPKTLTFKDMVESRLAQQGGYLQPTHTSQNGYAVYKVYLGDQLELVYFDEGVVFIRREGVWDPISVRELVGE